MSKDQFIDSVDRIAEQYANGEITYGQAHRDLWRLGMDPQDIVEKIYKWDLENAPVQQIEVGK